MSRTEEMGPLERDVRLGWTLYSAQPDNPEVGRIALRVLAEHPWVSGMRILLAKHRYACGEVAEARELLLGVVGLHDEQSLGAARELVILEHHQDDNAEALRWAAFVLRERQDRWRDWMDLGGMTALTGSFEEGWGLLDKAVEMCARTEADALPMALVRRALFLLQSLAPPERFIPAAEEAVRAAPADEAIGSPLIWGYLHQGRFGDAEELALRLLRLNPTDASASVPLTMIRNIRATLEKDGQTLGDLHRTGLFERLWKELRDQRLGLDLASALNALDAVMPAELRATLLPPLDEEAADAGDLTSEIAAWHAGQTPGAGRVWGLPGDFRLMSPAEFAAMDAAIEADPASYPQWRTEDLGEYYNQVMTDDAGGYLVELMTGQVIIRRSGADDEPVAESLSAWFWGRVAAFGGRDPRPAARQAGSSTVED
ncbi:tetratricopeptide repeat protein [Phytomonospora endophytica]|uniref:Tetratricopeptide (TPR) repeat protein n=1 Tax=Phytomonospora endophytica TaxID=714109 RepID=A0A841FSR0_9ACTN|nr:tetratricopeptide repeat protein [Phytomonospora endophytica]MBB6037843.1 tetratricopeptide (TPR) repeat protein [Phytomonospora endophytica]GIG68742.1 hypothetical protein Pen01_50370 [Phytomonospora endophytica]